MKTYIIHAKMIVIKTYIITEKIEAPSREYAEIFLQDDIEGALISELDDMYSAKNEREFVIEKG